MPILCLCLIPFFFGLMMLFRGGRDFLWEIDKEFQHGRGRHVRRSRQWDRMMIIAGIVIVIISSIFLALELEIWTWFR